MGQRKAEVFNCPDNTATPTPVLEVRMWPRGALRAIPTLAWSRPGPPYGIKGSSLYAGNPRRAMKSPPQGVRPTIIAVLPFWILPQ